MTDLSYHALYNSLKEIVEEKGEDYVYTTDPETVAKRGPGEFNEDCFYGGKDSSTPGCIIGHLIHKLNPEQNLDSLDGWGACGAMRVAGFDVNYRTQVGSFLAQVQRNQDSGKPWGQSLREAKEFADKYKELATV